MLSKFITVVFEKDYTLLQEAVGEELGSVGDNDAFSSSGEFEFICGAASLSVTDVNCEPVGANMLGDAKTRLSVSDEKWSELYSWQREQLHLASREHHGSVTLRVT